MSIQSLEFNGKDNLKYRRNSELTLSFSIFPEGLAGVSREIKRNKGVFWIFPQKSLTKFLNEIGKI